MPLKDRKTAQAAAKKSWQNRNLRNWRNQVADLREGRQITANGRIEWNGIYTAAKRKGVRVLRVKISDSQFAVAAARRYDRKIRFIQAGNAYYTRKSELAALSRAAEKAKVLLDIRLIHQGRRWEAIRVVLRQT